MSDSAFTCSNCGFSLSGGHDFKTLLSACPKCQEPIVSSDGSDNETESSLLESMNKEQLAAATHEGPENIMLLAGAGTGKTRTITARALHLLKTGVDPTRILLLTFTRRAAAEMKHRLQNELDEMAAGLFAGTFHRFCLDIMRGIPQVFNMEKVTVIDRDDQVALMRLGRGTIMSGQSKTGFPQAAKLVNFYSYARNTLVPVAQYLKQFTDYEPAQLQSILKICDFYEKRKKERGYVDFDDLLHRFADILAKDRNVRKKISSLFDHILVDEMQDTNPLQWMILENLYNPAQLFCVGDDAQSIYAFRGADFRNVHSFDQRVIKPKIMRLEENYRSTQEILDLANWLLVESPLNYNKHLRAHRGNGVFPTTKYFSGQIEEAEFISSDLEARHNQGVDWANHMILIRSAYTARTLESTLIEKKIPYRFIGGLSLLQTAHVKDMISLLRAAFDKLDELAWMRFLKLWPRIGDQTAASIFSDLVESDETIVNFLKKRIPNRTGIVDAVEQVNDNADDPGAAVRAAVDVLNPLLCEHYDKWTSRKRDLNVIAELAANFPSIKEFLEAYVLDPSHSTSTEPDEDQVTIITVHSAKGAECDVCYILQTQPGSFPHSRTSTEPELEEERRVLYVAITRAKNELIMTRNFDAMPKFEYSEFHLPDFLEEAPPKLLGRPGRTPRRSMSFVHNLRDLF
jgi:ATP-dependent DNA helicase UvrD/PcrA